MDENDIIELIRQAEATCELSKPALKKFSKKLRSLFNKGYKDFGYIRRVKKFTYYLDLTKKTFFRKYSDYILPSEYRSYLLESIDISNTYASGNKALGDEKRKKLNATSQMAGRIYNLYNSGILTIVFSKIDQMLEECKNKEEIRGTVSKHFDDILTDKAILYIGKYDDDKEAYSKVKHLLENKGYCLVHGAGENTSKIKYIHNTIVDDSELSELEVRTNKKEVGDIPHFYLYVFKKSYMRR